METRVPADDGGRTAPPGAGIDETVERRLAAIERRLSAIESSMDEAIAKGLQTAGEEMRRAVSDLGRLLLRDLDRLTKVLAEHRDTIVERLQDEGPAPPPGAAAPAEAAELEPVADEADRMVGEKGGWKAFGPRRRTKK
ncbi:MAG: hypothetical protein ACRD12_10015 [Acidimicrobiales bacterium]